MLPMKILTAQQMNKVDRLTTEEFGLPSLLLMENAGLNLYWYLHECFEDLSSQKIAILCGKGNNGGDGFALARQLLQRDIQPHVYPTRQNREGLWRCPPKSGGLWEIRRNNP